MNILDYKDGLPISDRAKKSKKVALGMSGGVDSSLSAYLLKNSGYDVTGVYIQCWDSKADGCRADEDRADAVEVASKLNIPFESLNFISEYKNTVIDYFYSEYRAGRTPNPDILCNKEIKFGLFLDWALKNGFDYVATGHYARVEKSLGFYRLLMGADEAKDQSYFLHRLGQQELSKVIFPIGELKKPDVRALAQEAGIKTHNKPDSQGICFIGEVDIKDFLKKRFDVKKGNVVTLDGEVVGEHEGVWFYTIGQRHGFHLSRYFGIPMYVVGKSIDNNELVVGFAKDVLKKTFDTEKIHWIGKEYKGDVACKVRVRHLGDLFDSVVRVKKDGSASVLAENEIFGVAPGQSAVFYIPHTKKQPTPSVGLSDNHSDTDMEAIGGAVISG